jgi:hypothetical protein
MTSLLQHWWTPAALLNGGLLHRLHWLFLSVAYFCILYSIALMWKLSAETKRQNVEMRKERRSRLSLLALLSSMNRNEKNGAMILIDLPKVCETTQPAWGATLARFARRSITITASATKNVLAGASRGFRPSMSKADCCGKCIFYKKGICMVRQVHKMQEDWCAEFSDRSAMPMAGD